MNRIRPVYDLLSSDDDFVTPPSKSGKPKRYSTRRETKVCKDVTNVTSKTRNTSSSKSNLNSSSTSYTSVTVGKNTNTPTAAVKEKKKRNSETDMIRSTKKCHSVAENLFYDASTHAPNVTKVTPKREVDYDSDESTYYDVKEHWDKMLSFFDASFDYFAKGYEEAVLLRANYDFEEQERKSSALKVERDENLVVPETEQDDHYVDLR